MFVFVFLSVSVLFMLLLLLPLLQFLHLVGVLALVHHRQVTVLLPALHTVELLNVFGVLLGDIDTVPVVPLLTMITAAEINVMSVSSLFSQTYIMNLVTSVLLQMQYRVSPSSPCASSSELVNILTILRDLSANF